MTFPVLAFTPNGVMPYSRYENLLRVMRHEFDKNWYRELEVVDSKGVCAVIRSAKIVKEPLLAKLFGRMVEVEIVDSEKLADYDVHVFRDRVLEYLSVYPDMYQAAGLYDEIVRRVRHARDSGLIVKAFLE